MQRDLVLKSRSLGASTDLTLLAPIKPGLVESLETVTYKTRIKRVLDALHTGRTSSHEFAAARLLSDAVERVGAIQSVRVAVLEPENKVLLSVSFDGSWQAYIRVLWDKVGTLLDLIFCGTVDYVTSNDHSYDEWCAWARRVQVETGFFYGPTEASARDLLFHRRIERMTVRGAGGELQDLRAVLPGAELLAAALVVPLPDPQADDPPVIQAPVPMRAVLELFTLGLQGLSGLYRLADLHRPGTADGEVLRRAALDLLREFVQICSDGAVADALKLAEAGRFTRALAWLGGTSGVIGLPTRQLPPPASTQADTLGAEQLHRLQAGIVRPFDGVTHGALLLLAFDDVRAAGNFMAWVMPRISDGARDGPAAPEAPFSTIGFSPCGLRALGLDEDTLALFPEEYRQGMAARAGLLGDVRHNHPRRWRLPRRAAWPAEPDVEAAPEVEVDTVHAVLQLRCHAASLPAGWPLNDPTHPLKPFVDTLVSDNPGVRLLAWQEMSRDFSRSADGKAPPEHFGYSDGNGQPDIEKPKVPNALNRVHLGEVVLGHDNVADDTPDPSDPALPAADRDRLQWLTDGSFLVVRKYRQYVHRLERSVRATAEAMSQQWQGTVPEQHEETVYAKLMGRTRGGTPLVPHVPPNTFSYASDPVGRSCPLHAHVRMAHPRAEHAGGARPPRLMRRGMSYGPPHAPGVDDDAMDRGLVFMAYNASLGEQFEVVQRWLAGGNSTGSSSGQSCPILGVPENGLPRHFRFEHTVGASTQVVRVPLEDGTPLFEEPAMLTQLQWGLYLFTPSMAVLDRLCRQALAAALKPARPAVPWQAWHGRELLAALRQLQAEQGHAAAAAAWKVAIEDPDAVDRLDAAALWAAIREDHGGALHTPYGVLLASRELIAQVLDDGTGLYSICGQRERMQRSFGDIFLGMDDGPRYRDEAGPVNAAIGQLQNPPAGQRSAFDIALQAANDKLTAIVDESKGLAYSGGAPRFEVAFDAREVLDEVLAALCEFWFGMRKQGPHLVAGGTNWHWQDHEPPLYPGHFTALSRYMFQPNPGAMPEELSVRYGQALMRAMTAFVAEHRAAGTVPQSPDKQEAPIAAAIFRHPTQGIDDAWVARTMLGVMMGFIAPIIGAALNVLREWQRTGQFAAVRAQLAGDTGRARAVVLRPMWAAAQMRPMPQIIWRTATAAHRLGGPGAHGVDVAAGQKVVLGLASGTQQSLQEGAEDITPMFGGDRSAAHHPTHACPGRDAGTQALLGTLTALLVAQCGRDERLRCSPVTWGFVAEGPAPAAAKQRHLHPTSLHGAVAAARPPDQPLPAPPPQRKGLVLAVGDSWLHSPYGDGNDLRQQLERWGWTVPGALCNYLTWGKAETLARKLDALRSGFIRMAGEHPDLPLQAVLISAGGNDSTGAAFAKLLDPDDGDPISSPLNAGALGRHLEQLVAWYRLVIDCVRSVLHDDLGLDVPVLLHGYDHSQLPLDAVTLPHWFRIPFENMHYDPVQDRKEELTCMARLIGSFNDRLRDLAASPDYTGGVRWVNLQGTIAAHWNDPADGWRDDLHPHADAFVALAARIDAALTTAYPRLLRVTPSA